MHFLCGLPTNFWEEYVPVTLDGWTGRVFIRNSVQCLTCSRSCVLWYSFPEVKVSSFPYSGKVHCSESTSPLVAIALQLIAFRGKRIYSSQLTELLSNAFSWKQYFLVRAVSSVLVSGSLPLLLLTVHPLVYKALTSDLHHCSIGRSWFRYCQPWWELPPHHSFDRIDHTFSIEFYAARLALGTFHAHFNSASHQFYWCWDKGGNLWFVSSWTAAAAVIWAWPWYWFWPCLSHLGMFFRGDVS